MARTGGSLRDDCPAVLAELPHRVTTSGRDEAEHVLDGEVPRRHGESDHRAVAAPFPVLAPVAQSGSNGVLDHVSARLQEVRVRRDELAPKPPAEQMIRSSVT